MTCYFDSFPVPRRGTIELVPSFQINPGASFAEHVYGLYPGGELANLTLSELFTAEALAPPPPVGAARVEDQPVGPGPSSTGLALANDVASEPPRRTSRRRVEQSVQSVYVQSAASLLEELLATNADSADGAAALRARAFAMLSDAVRGVPRISNTPRDHIDVLVAGCGVTGWTHAVRDLGLVAPHVKVVLYCVDNDGGLLQHVGARSVNVEVVCLRKTLGASSWGFVDELVALLPKDFDGFDLVFGDACCNADASRRANAKNPAKPSVAVLHAALAVAMHTVVHYPGVLLEFASEYVKADRALFLQRSGFLHASHTVGPRDIYSAKGGDGDGLLDGFREFACRAKWGLDAAALDYGKEGFYGSQADSALDAVVEPQIGAIILLEAFVGVVPLGPAWAACGSAVFAAESAGQLRVARHDVALCALEQTHHVAVYQCKMSCRSGPLRRGAPTRTKHTESCLSCFWAVERHRRYTVAHALLNMTAVELVAHHCVLNALIFCPVVGKEKPVPGVVRGAANGAVVVDVCSTREKRHLKPGDVALRCAVGILGPQQIYPTIAELRPPRYCDLLSCLVCHP
jgi:hypothetical protein